MALRITIDVFSGRPNPVGIVSGLEEKDLLARLAPRKGARTGKAGRAPRLPPSTLGYRGLLVERLPEPGQKRGGAAPERFRVAAGFVHGRGAPVPTHDPHVEEFVCGTNGPLRDIGLPREFFEFCPIEVLRFRELLRRWPWKNWPWLNKYSCACAPLWEPVWWNDDGKKQWNNNCYNYGTNYRTDTFAQPGRANGNQYSSITCAEVKSGAVSDALIDWPSANNKCPKEGHLVALVVDDLAPSFDYHWYRKGRNGLWTHKPGGTPATALDNSGNLISDPRTCDRGRYVTFCTFMVVMHGHVKIN